MAIGSCQYPGSFFDHDFAYRAWRELTDSTGQLRAQSMILLGDQIYADATAGLFEQENPETQYLYPYEQLHARLRDLKIPPDKYSLNDDHEMIENWEPDSPDGVTTVEAKNARAFGLNCYREHGFCKGYPSIGCNGPYFRTIDNIDLPVFLCDTRTEREHRTYSNFLDAKLISTQQMQALKDWLLAHKQDSLKIIASPAAVLPRLAAASRPQSINEQQVHLPFISSAIRSDSWDGYPDTLCDLLAFIAKESLSGIVFVSGDFHFSSVSKLILEYQSVTTTVNLIHCSGLYTPYHFANASPSDFLLQDEFWVPDLKHGGLSIARNESLPVRDCIRCQLETELVPAGDGFCFIGQPAASTINIEFSRPSLAENPVYRRSL